MPRKEAFRDDRRRSSDLEQDMFHGCLVFRVPLDFEGFGVSGLGA